MSSSSPLLVILVIIISLISPAISQTCKSQNLQSSFQTCLDLPVLNSSLHYTYNATNSSLSVAFIATPSQPNGWVAWAINPTKTGMIGSQAFVAHRSGSVPNVKTYNISSYVLTEGPLSFDFWNLRVETMSGDRIAIYTTVKVPKGSDDVNHVWQIGGVWNTSTDSPGAHPTTPGSANLKSTGELNLSDDAPSGAPTNGSRPPRNAGSMSTHVNSGVTLGILVLLGSVFAF